MSGSAERVPVTYDVQQIRSGLKQDERSLRQTLEVSGPTTAPIIQRGIYTSSSMLIALHKRNTPLEPSEFRRLEEGAREFADFILTGKHPGQNPRS